MTMNKSKAILIVAIITLVAYLFLPYAFGASVFDLISAGIVSFDVLLTIAAAIITIIGAVKQSKGMMLTGAIVGAVLMLAGIGMSSDIYGDAIIEVLGIGFYITTIGFIVNIVLSAMIKNNQQ